MICSFSNVTGYI